MAMQDPTTVAAKWSRNLAASTASITAGVNAVTVNPAQTAASQSAAYLAGVQNAVTSGKWQRGLARTTLQSWQQSMITKGIPRIASGASAAQPKVQAFMSKWLPYQQGLQAKLAATPRGDLSTNIQRAVTAMQYNAAFVYTQ